MVGLSRPRSQSKLPATADGLPASFLKVAFLIVRNPVFEGAMALVIIMNFAMVVVEADITAEDANGESRKAPAWMGACSWGVLVIFVIELALRIFVERYQFLADGWNIFDFFIVFVDAICSFLGLFMGSVVPVSAMRILRLCKLTRVTKVFRAFPELRLMMAGLIGSLRTIFWGMVLLFLFLLVWATIGVQFIHPLNRRIALSGFYEQQGCERCPFAYDSVWHALITLLSQNVAGDAWSQVTVPIIEAHPLTSIYFVGVMATISIAVMNLILGVIVNVAMQSRDDLSSQLEKEQIITRIKAQSHLREICDSMDKDKSGYLSKAELLEGFEHNEAFRQLLDDLGIKQDDLDILWTILDPDKDGQVLFDEFIHKSYSLRESDAQYMLAYVKFYVTKIKDSLCEQMQQAKQEQQEQQAKLVEEMHKVEEGMHKVGEEVHKEQEQKAKLVEEIHNIGDEVHKVGEEVHKVEVKKNRVKDTIKESFHCQKKLSLSTCTTPLQAQTSGSTISTASETMDASLRFSTEDLQTLTSIMSKNIQELNRKLDLWISVDGRCAPDPQQQIVTAPQTHIRNDQQEHFNEYRQYSGPSEHGRAPYSL